jgi:hypothetical protein
MKVFNLGNDTEVEFIDTDPEWAVAYCYCGDNLMLSALYAAREDGRLHEFYRTLPFTSSQFSVACGDWAVRREVT